MEIQKKAVAAAATIIVLLSVVLCIVYLSKPAQAASLDYETTCNGIVDKKPGETFTVKITFKNRGSTEGTWNITVTFEGEDWIWKGEKKQLTLEPDEKETLTWEGKVPQDAAVDSVARLIVYYEDKCVALNWWIHVISGAELCIVDSKVS
jgi:uncharacterized membrane protein